MRRYTARVAKTSVEVDQDIVKQVSEVLGTKTLKDTIDAALREVLSARRRMELITMLAEPGTLDFEAAEHAWGGDS